MLVFKMNESRLYSSGLKKQYSAKYLISKELRFIKACYLYKSKILIFKVFKLNCTSHILFVLYILFYIHHVIQDVYKYMISKFANQNEMFEKISYKNIAIIKL